LLWSALVKPGRIQRMKSATIVRSPENERQNLINEIEQLRRELATRQSFARPAPRSVVYAYHELLERHYDRLDRLAVE
jgi:hypothetical protein